MQTEKLQLKATVTKAADGRVTIVASDETIDRSGEAIPVSSWDLSNFQKSPRLLIDHDYSVKSIVGLAENVRSENRQLLFEPLFHDITDAARETKEMVEQGFLDTVSVGFMRNQTQDGSMKNELLEISFVAVPCNPNARTLSVKDIGDTEAKAVEAFIGKAEEPEKPAEPAPAEETKPPEPEAKAGRTISTDTRSQIENAINLLEQASGALEQLLNGAEAQSSEGKDAPDGSAPKQRSSDEGSDEEVFKQWLLQRQVLRAVNTATSEALAKSKLFIRTK
ncbi:MAG: HK97 family phage prohead protease [Patescibacteria group bacterium]